MEWADGVPCVAPCCWEFGIIALDTGFLEQGEMMWCYLLVFCVVCCHWWSVDWIGDDEDEQNVTVGKWRL